MERVPGQKRRHPREHPYHRILFVRSLMRETGEDPVVLLLDLALGLLEQAAVAPGGRVVRAHGRFCGGCSK